MKGGDVDEETIAFTMSANRSNLIGESAYEKLKK